MEGAPGSRCAQEKNGIRGSGNREIHLGGHQRNDRTLVEINRMDRLGPGFCNKGWEVHNVENQDQHRPRRPPFSLLNLPRRADIGECVSHTRSRNSSVNLKAFPLLIVAYYAQTSTLEGLNQ